MGEGYNSCWCGKTASLYLLAIQGGWKMRICLGSGWGLQAAPTPTWGRGRRVGVV